MRRRLGAARGTRKRACGPARVRRNNSRIRKLSDSRIFRASIADSGFSHGRQEPIRALGWTPGAARLAARARPCSPASVAQCAPCSAARIVVQALPARARHPAALQFPTSTPARRPPIPTRFGDAPPVTQGLICPQRWPGRYAPPAPCCARWPACCHWPRRPPAHAGAMPWHQGPGLCRAPGRRPAVHEPGYRLERRGGRLRAAGLPDRQRRRRGRRLHAGPRARRARGLCLHGASAR